MNLHDDLDHDDRNDSPVWKEGTCLIHARQFWWIEDWKSGDRSSFCPDCEDEVNQRRRLERAAEMKRGAA